MDKRILLVAAALVASGASARAESIACEKTETQAECFSRLKCRPSEELADCQKRLAKCTADNKPLDSCKKGDQSGGAQHDNADHHGEDRGTTQRNGDDGREREREREQDRERDRDRDRDRDRSDNNSGGERRSGSRR